MIRRARDVRGTVLVEILIAFLPLFALFLGLVQYALLSVAQLVVQHAAVAGARAAAVVLDDDPAEYDGAARLDLLDAPRGAGQGPSEVLPLIAQRISPGTDSFVAPSWMNLGLLAFAGPRVSAIRSAVYARLAAIVPPRALVTLNPIGTLPRSVDRALGDTPISRLLQAPFYLPISTAVTFPRKPHGRELFVQRIEAGTSLVTVRVTHVALCEIPIAAQIMCDSFSAATDARVHPAARDLGYAAGAAFQWLWLGTDARVVVLQAEATMPLQLASYKYGSELAAGGGGT